MAQAAHLICAFPEDALRIADKLGDIARGYGLAAWTHARTSGEWEICIEGEENCLRRFATEVGFRNLALSAGSESR
jgi:hypothetical protein